MCVHLIYKAPTSLTAKSNRKDSGYEFIYMYVQIFRYHDKIKNNILWNAQNWETYSLFLFWMSVSYILTISNPLSQWKTDSVAACIYVFWLPVSILNDMLFHSIYYKEWFKNSMIFWYFGWAFTRTLLFYIDIIFPPWPVIRACKIMKTISTLGINMYKWQTGNVFNSNIHRVFQPNELLLKFNASLLSIIQILIKNFF